MWTAYGHDGEDPEEFHRRMSAPENEIPVALAVNVLLARSEDAAVALVGPQVYTTGVSFTLIVRARPSSELARTRGLNELIWQHGPEAGRFLLGIELADGRRAGGTRMGRGESDVVFHPGGGSGGEASVEQSWWLSPLPPEGPLTFVVRCPDLGIAETATELDGSAIRRAADDVVTLWPWSPPDRGERPPPPPPDLPAGSWFSGS